MRGRTIAGIIIILIGLNILFNFHVFNFIFAVIVLWIGVRIISGRSRWGSSWSEKGGITSESYLSRVLVFSGIKTKINTESFEGMELVTIFGGGEIDAGSVTTKKKDINIDLVSIFGGIKLKVPKGWAVKSEGIGILGGFDNNTESTAKSGVTIHLKGVAVLGGVEVVN